VFVERRSTPPDGARQKPIPTMINLPETESLVTACVIIVLSILFLLFGRNTKQIKSCLDPETFTSLQLIQKQSVSHDTRKFTFALPNGPEGLLGLPVGQHITLKFTETKDGETKNHMRSYTPITGNDTPGSVTFVIKVYKAGVHPKFPDGGKMSQYLDTLNIGDTVAMRGPKGEYIIGRLLSEGIYVTFLSCLCCCCCWLVGWRAM